MLKFFGRGAGFGEDHTSAYFESHKQLVLIDCSSSSYFKFKKMDLSGYEEIFVLITHTHGDHIGCLGLLVQYAHFALKKPITIVAPSKSVYDDLVTILTIEDNMPDWYEIVIATDLKEEWFGTAICTKHSNYILKEKCYGYQLIIDGINVVYTGDTYTLEPYQKYLKDGSFLYVDTSFYASDVHLNLSEIIDELVSYTKRDIKVYLIHMDDVEKAEEYVKEFQNINVVTVI